MAFGVPGKAARAFCTAHIVRMPAIVMTFVCTCGVLTIAFHHLPIVTASFTGGAFQNTGIVCPYAHVVTLNDCHICESPSE